MVVDAAMNDLMRPTLYEAYHDVKPVVLPDIDTRKHRRRPPSARCARRATIWRSIVDAMAQGGRPGSR